MAANLSVNAIETHLHYFLGTDHLFIMTDLDGADMDGWALSFMVKRRRTDDDDDAILTYTTGSPSGVTVADDVVTVAVDSDDTDDLRAAIYHWELKRTDTNAETVVGFGTFTMQRGVHHA